MRSISALILFLALTGCANHNLRTPLRSETSAIDLGYLDLQPGWRLRVVTPILKSGGYRVQSLQPIGANSGDLRAGPDFIGYESDYYEITRSGAGVRVEFGSAETVKDGRTTRQPHPLVALFDLPANILYIRLIYLVRVSEADHDMAIVGGDDPETLDQLTSALQTHPDTKCAPDSHSYCLWVPAGIAVRPEEWRATNGKKQWAPVH